MKFLDLLLLIGVVEVEVVDELDCEMNERTRRKESASSFVKVARRKTKAGTKARTLFRHEEMHEGEELCEEETRVEKR